MDDANVPSLLAMPYLGTCSEAIRVSSNPPLRSERGKSLFLPRHAAEGIGGPHIGQDMIWPMAIIMRALTTDDDKEQRNASPGSRPRTPEPASCTRASTRTILQNSPVQWFAWANTFFGELILKLDKTNPKLLEKA